MLGGGQAQESSILLPRHDTVLWDIDQMPWKVVASIRKTSIFSKRDNIPVELESVEKRLTTTASLGD
jgi:hypothetical protein